MGEALGVFMRWLHYTSLTTLIGGILYGRLVMVPSSAVLAPDERAALGDRAAAAFRPYVLAAICGLVVSGVYNILTHPGHRPIYEVLLGIKLLLALHVFTVALLIARPGHPRRSRMMTGVAVSGLVIIAIAAYLQHIF
jgi:cytochrome bd-type quinol oxidase subunit 2